MRASQKLWELVEISAQYQSLYEVALNSGDATQEDLDMIGHEAASIIGEKIVKFLNEYKIDDVDDGVVEETDDFTWTNYKNDDEE